MSKQFWYCVLTIVLFFGLSGAFDVANAETADADWHFKAGTKYGKSLTSDMHDYTVIDATLESPDGALLLDYFIPDTAWIRYVNVYGEELTITRVNYTLGVSTAFKGEFIDYNGKSGWGIRYSPEHWARDSALLQAFDVALFKMEGGHSYGAVVDFMYEFDPGYGIEGNVYSIGYRDNWDTALDVAFWHNLYPEGNLRIYAGYADWDVYKWDGDIQVKRDGMFYVAVKVDL